LAPALKAMRTFLTPVNGKEPVERKDYWLTFACGTVAIHLLVVFFWFFHPTWAFYPRPPGFWYFVGGGLFFLMLPFCWSVCLLFICRSSRERIASYVSLAASVPWLLMAVLLVLDVFGGPSFRL
jgi:hypothetical protein